jgi:hypothetical protein
MLRFFSQLTGDSYELVRQHGPASRKKVIAMGTGLLLVSVLWLLTGFNLALNALGLTMPTALCIGAALGTAVFMLDRMIILGTGQSKFIAAIRVLLALLMAIIGGIGLDLCLLRSEIDQTLVSVHRERVEAAREAIRSAHAPEMEQAVDRVRVAREAKEAATSHWLAELNGSPNGTGRYGNGSVAKAKKGLVDLGISELQVAETELADLSKRVEKAEADELLSIKQAQLGPALFDRIHAMHRYLLSDPVVMIAYLIISFILVLFELSPLMAKWGMEVTAYESGARVADQMQREMTLLREELFRAQVARWRTMTPVERQAVSELQRARLTYGSK